MEMQLGGIWSQQLLHGLEICLWKSDTSEGIWFLSHSLPQLSVLAPYKAVYQLTASRSTERVEAGLSLSLSLPTADFWLYLPRCPSSLLHPACMHRHSLVLQCLSLWLWVSFSLSLFLSLSGLRSTTVYSLGVFQFRTSWIFLSTAGFQYWLYYLPIARVFSRFLVSSRVFTCPSHACSHHSLRTISTIIIGSVVIISTITAASVITHTHIYQRLTSAAAGILSRDLRL